MLAYFAILSSALAGYAGAPPWTIAAGAIALAAISYSEHAEIHNRGHELGLNRIVNVTLLRSILLALVAATVAYGGGWALKWL